MISIARHPGFRERVIRTKVTAPFTSANSGASSNMVLINGYGFLRPLEIDRMRSEGEDRAACPCGDQVLGKACSNWRRAFDAAREIIHHSTNSDTGRQYHNTWRRRVYICEPPVRTAAAQRPSVLVRIVRPIVLPLCWIYSRVATFEGNYGH